MGKLCSSTVDKTFWGRFFVGRVATWLDLDAGFTIGPKNCCLESIHMYVYIYILLLHHYIDT